jgi:hypothetical protein
MVLSYGIAHQFGLQDLHANRATVEQEAAPAFL